MTTYKICDLFRLAIVANPNITQERFPKLFLNKNTSKTKGNVSKITKQAYKRLMVFIARLYSAHSVYYANTSVPPAFSFEVHPDMEPVFVCLEASLPDPNDEKEKAPVNRTPLELVQILTTNLDGLKKETDRASARIMNMNVVVTEMSRKLKMEQNAGKVERKREAPSSEESSQVGSDVREMSLEEKVQFLFREKMKRKKKKKHKKHH